MDKKNKISFIPQSPISRKSHGPKRPLSLMLTLSFVLFFLTFAMYGGMFYYKYRLDKSLKNKESELSSAKKRLDPDNAMERAQEFQEKIGNIKKLLGSHVAPSVIFNLLQEITLKSIEFSTYKFSSTKGNSIQNTKYQKPKEKNPTLFSVELKGKAPSYRSLAYQSDVIKKEIKSNKRISSFDISDISLDKVGSVSFSLKLNIVPSFINYENVIKQEQVSTTTVKSTIQPSGKDISASNNAGVGELNNLLNGNK